MWNLISIVIMTVVVGAGCVTPSAGQQTNDAGTKGTTAGQDEAGAAVTISGKTPIEHRVHRCPEGSDPETRRPSVAVGVATDVPTHGRKQAHIVTDVECP